MQCHACGNAVTGDERFCRTCGASLAGVTDATQALDRIEDSDAAMASQSSNEPDDGLQDAEPGWHDVDPVWATTGPLPIVDTHLAAPRSIPFVEAATTAASDGSITDSLPSTEPITEVWMRPDETTAVDGPPAATPRPAVVTTPEVGAWSDSGSMTAEMSVVPTALRERAHFRPTAVTGLAVLTSILALVANFATIVSVSSTVRLIPTDATPTAFRTGSWISDDLADNLSIATLIAVALVITGGVAAGFAWRGGSGLAAGAGLAIAGLSALTLGIAQIPIDAAYEMASIPSEQEFTLTITRDLGYWLQPIAGALGILTFFAAVNDAFGDRRRGLNPWFAALGALAGLVLAGGPLIPEQLATMSDNWYLNDAPGAAPAMLLAGRLVQLGLIALTAVIGFLSVRRWGLGLAIGGGIPAVWLVVSTRFEITDRPVGPGYANPGATGIDVHGVTVIGASAIVAFGLLALVGAYDQARHEW